MSRRIKDFIQIGDHQTLDVLIERLIQVRDRLPAVAEAEVRMRGDDVFGRQLSISYYREQTIEEAECDARYANAYRESRERKLSLLQDDAEAPCRTPQGRMSKLRAVA